MFRFTIRELLILTLTAGLAVGWWLDHRRFSKERSVFEEREFLSKLQYATETGRPVVPDYSKAHPGSE